MSKRYVTDADLEMHPEQQQAYVDFSTARAILHRQAYVLTCDIEAGKNGDHEAGTRVFSNEQALTQAAEQYTQALHVFLQHDTQRIRQPTV